MTKNGDPYENAIAERVNGILREEFNLYRDFINIHQANAVIKEGIDAYNNLRPHASLDYLTPQKAYEQNGPLKKRWKQRKKQNHEG